MENSNKITVSLEEVLYYLFFSFLFFAKGIGLYDGQIAFKVILIAAVICLLGKLCIGNYRVNEIALMAFIILITGIAYLKSGDKGILLYGFMMIGLKNVDMNRLYKMALAIWSIAFGALWLVSLTHMKDTAYRVANKLGLEHIFRWSMGYAHPNVLHISYLILMILVILTLGEKIKLRHYVGLVLGNLFVFIFSVSYTGVAICFLLIMGRGYLQIRKDVSNLEKILLGIVFPMCVMISIVAPVILKGRAFDILNKLLNTRLYLAQYYLKGEYFSLFGTRVADITSANLTMDNAYVYALIAYGVIPFSILCVSFFLLLIVLLKKDRLIETIAVISLLVSGLTEPFLFNASFKNLGFIFLGNILFEYTKGKKGIICFFEQGNREYTLQLNKVCEKWKELKIHVQEQIKWILVGGGVGVILTLFGYQVMNKQPEGYIVSRVRCEDISEEITLFEEIDFEYDNYCYMGEFEPGDEVEIFSGDIVMMERIRGYLMCLLGGGMAGAVIAITFTRIKRR